MADITQLPATSLVRSPVRMYSAARIPMALQARILCMRKV